jgi:hypothetical protein
MTRDFSEDLYLALRLADVADELSTTLLPSNKPLIMWVFLARLDLHYS